MTDEKRTAWSDPMDLGTVFFSPPKPFRWLIENRIQLGRGGLLTGIGGSSKTRLLYHLAVGCALGRLPWDWEVAKQGRTVLVLTEDTREDVQRTLHAIGQGLHLTDAEQAAVVNRMTIFPLAGHDVKLLYRNEFGALSKTAEFDRLQGLIEGLGDVVLIGIDPALSITDGDELNQNDQRSLGKMADDLAVRTGATCMLASHATKNSQQSDELSSHNSRGGGAITDAVRMEFAMRTMTAAEAAKAGIIDLEERKRHVQLVATKGNHLPPAAFVPVWLRRGEYGVLTAADVQFREDTGPGSKDMAALDILRDMAAIESPKLDDWRRRCADAKLIPQINGDARDREKQKKAMDRIRSRLLSAGLIQRGFARGIYQPVMEQ